MTSSVTQTQRAENNRAAHDKRLAHIMDLFFIDSCAEFHVDAPTYFPLFTLRVCLAVIAAQMGQLLTLKNIFSRSRYYADRVV